jgi:hypothetical protein
VVGVGVGWRRVLGVVSTYGMVDTTDQEARVMSLASRYRISRYDN